MFVGIKEVARAFENGECTDYREGKVVKAATKLIEIEFVGLFLAFALGHLEIVGHVVIDFADFLLGRKGLCDALREQADIARMREEHRFGRRTVAAGTSRLLEIGFQGIGRIKVYHQSHIGFVDAHAEGIGGHHHAGAVLLPSFLSRTLIGGGQPRVVVERRDACGLQSQGRVARSAA